MSRIKHLTSLDNPQVKAVVRLRNQRERRKRGLFVAEGIREVSRALAADLALRQLYWCGQLLGAAEQDVLRIVEKVGGQSNAATASEPAACFTVTPKVMTKLAYRKTPEGIVGVFEQPQWEVESVLGHEGVLPSDRGLWLVVVGIEKPGNLGAMARSAEAAGATALIVADGVVDAFNPNAIRASTGAVFRLPIVGIDSNQLISRLRRYHIRVVASAPGARRPYTETDMTGALAIVIGPEDQGLDPRWLHPAKSGKWGWQLASIPVLGQTVDSLNASAAAAVLLFEAVRQRRAAKPDKSKKSVDPSPST